MAASVLGSFSEAENKQTNRSALPNFLSGVDAPMPDLF